MTVSEAIETERRLTTLEQGFRDHDRRLAKVEGMREDMERRDMARERALTKLGTQVARLVKDFEKLSGDQQRFIIGAALTAGGLLFQVFRAKVGL